jgi:DNA-binding GntR family transcriptional regulator
METISLRPPIRQPRLRDQVYASLRELIRNGHFPAAGAVEQDLASQLKVSRTPLREALFQLCREGMLEDSGRGYRVPELTRQDINDIVELRRMIEPAAAALVATRADDAAVEALDQQMQAERAAHLAGDVDSFIAANGGFRAALLAACGNSRIAQVVSTMDDQIQRLRCRTLDVSENRAMTIGCHERAVAAVRARDADGASAAMLDLVAAMRSYYEAIW